MSPWFIVVYHLLFKFDSLLVTFYDLRVDRLFISLFILSFSEMDLQSPCVLVLSGKSPAETEFAKTLKSSSTLKLPDNSEVRIFVHPDTQRPPSEESFQIDLFLKSLLTSRFGRFFIWSPCLPSTHDVVTQ